MNAPTTTQVTLTFAKLRQQAHRTAAARGHRMNPGAAVKVGPARWVYDYACLACGMQVRVNANPPPNDAAVTGEAVALNCLKK